MKTVSEICKENLILASLDKKYGSTIMNSSIDIDIKSGYVENVIDFNLIPIINDIEFQYNGLQFNLVGIVDYFDDLLKSDTVATNVISFSELTNLSILLLPTLEDIISIYNFASKYNLQDILDSIDKLQFLVKAIPISNFYILDKNSNIIDKTDFMHTYIEIEDSNTYCKTITSIKNRLENGFYDIKDWDIYNSDKDALINSIYGSIYLNARATFARPFETSAQMTQLALINVPNNTMKQFVLLHEISHLFINSLVFSYINNSNVNNLETSSTNALLHEVLADTIALIIISRRYKNNISYIISCIDLIEISLVHYAMQPVYRSRVAEERCTIMRKLFVEKLVPDLLKFIEK